MVVITYLAQDENSPQSLPFDHVRLCVTGFLEPPVSNSVVFRRFIWLLAVLALWLLIFGGNLLIGLRVPVKTPLGWATVRGHHLGIAGSVVVLLRVASDWRAWTGTFRKEDSGTRYQLPTATASIVFSSDLWAGVKWRRSWSDWVYSGSFGLPFKAFFSVNFRSHSIGPKTQGCCKVIFILIQAIGCVGSSCKGISGDNFSVKSSFESSSKGWSSAFSSKGSATPKFSAASSSKGSVLLNQLRSQSLKGRYDRNLRKRVLHLKALWSRSRWRGAHLQGICISQVHWYVISSGREVLEVRRSRQLGGAAAFFDSGSVKRKACGIWLASGHRYLSCIQVQRVSGWLGHCRVNSVLDVYHQTPHSCGQFDKAIILSHIERSKKNLEFLLRSTQMNHLPVDLVFVTKTRTGAGGRAAVLQALLGDRNIARLVLLDDNWRVCFEIERVGGIPLNIKT